MKFRIGFPSWFLLTIIAIEKIFLIILDISKMNKVAIEHDLTRQHLQNAFEGLFIKFDKNFDSDDEIDIMDLTVVKRGRTLEAMKPLDFGDAYRYKCHRKKRWKNTEDQSKEVMAMFKGSDDPTKLSSDRPKKRGRPKLHNKEDEQIAQKIFESIRNVNQ